MNNGPSLMDHLIRWFTIFAPLTIVCLWGIIFSIKKIRRARKPSLLVIIGLSILLLTNVLFKILMNTFSIPQMSHYIGDVLSYRWVQDGSTILWLCGEAVGIAILVYAVFVDRPVSVSFSN